MKSATGFLSETETELVMATSIFNKRLKLRSADDDDDDDDDDDYF